MDALKPLSDEALDHAYCVRDCVDRARVSATWARSRAARLYAAWAHESAAWARTYATKAREAGWKR
jgi:hypothetical protein